MAAPQDRIGGPIALEVALSLETDAATGMLVTALRAEGIRSVLLKGPVIASWLYEDGTPRPYVDADLLVAQETFESAARVAANLGFDVELPTPGTDPEGGPFAALPLGRGDGMVQLDLHRTIPAVSAPPPKTWRVVGELTEPMLVGGVEVEVPRLPLRALIVALHAAQHGPDTPKPLRDLGRAIARTRYEVWEQALDIAEELEATPALALGLRLDPAGAELASRLGLASANLVELATTQGSRARVVLGFKRLAEAPGVGRKAEVVAEELFPSPDFMRWRSALARRGPLGLVAAYGGRLAWMLWHAGPSLRAWRQSKRDQRPAATDR